MSRLVFISLVLLLGCCVTTGHNLDCDFTDGFCAWSNKEDQPQDWVVESVESGNEGFLVFKPSWGSKDFVTTLQSPLIQTPPAGDFRFSYWTVINGNGTLKVRLAFYSKDDQFTEETVVFEQGKSTSGKQDAIIPITNEDGFSRIFIDAVIGDGFYGVVHLNDFKLKIVCDDAWCENGGTCVEGEDSTFECLCPSGFSGDKCEQCSSKDTFCSDVELSMTARPESLSTCASDSFKLKCTVNTALVFSSEENGICEEVDQQNTMTSLFRAVTSIVIKKENKTTGLKEPIAMVSCVDRPISFLDEGAVKVEGRVKVTENLINGDVLAYLNVHWPNPDQSQVGTYICHVTGLDTLGQRVEGEVRAEVIEHLETMDSLHAKIVELKEKNKVVDSLHARIAELEKEDKSLDSLRARIMELEKENKILQMKAEILNKN